MLIPKKQNPDANKIYPKSLTALRFFAVMFIVLHHLRLAFQPSILSDPRFVNFGVIGVTFFLFLSGFVMTLHYNKFSQSKQSIYFIWNRAVRIYPVHILTFFFSIIVVYLWNQPIQASTAIINVLLLQSYFPSETIYFSFNAVSWMISTLFFFYLVFAFANRRPNSFFWIFLISLLSLVVSMYYIENNQTSNALWLLYIFPPTGCLYVYAVLFCIIFFKISQTT